MTNRRAYLASLVQILSFLFTKLSLPVVLGADDYGGVRLLTDIRYDQSTNHDAFSTKGRSLIASYDSRMFTADVINIPAELIVELPDQGSTTFSKSSFQVIGPTDRISGNAFRVWNGKSKHDHKIFSSGKASIVLLPSGNLFCDIKLGDKKFECKPCEQEQNLGTAQKSCVKLTEAVPQKLMENMPSESYMKKYPQFSKELSALDRIVPNSYRGIQKLEDAGNSNNRFLFDKGNAGPTRNLVDDGTVFDVAMFYTAGVLEHFGSEEAVHGLISIAVSRLNEIYSNTDIELEARIVYWGPVDYDDDNSNRGISYLQGNNSVQLVRDEFGADFLTILTMGALTTSTGPNPPSEETDEMIYSTIGAEYMLEFYTLPWAYGLLFGCELDYENSFRSRLIPYAYGYQSVNCDFTTIMGTPCENEFYNRVVVDAYSSPLYTWPATGEPIGNADIADCSRAISESKVFIAQYRDTVVMDSTSFPTPSSTFAPTVMPTPIFTSMPTSLVTGCADDCFSIQLESTLINQVTWEERLMGNSFITAVQDVTQSVLDAEESNVIIEEVEEGGYTRSNDSIAILYSAIKITYSVKHIYTEAATFDVFNTIYNASDSGELAQTLVNSSLYYSVISIITEQIDSSTSNSASSWTHNSILCIPLILIYVFLNW